MLLLLAGIIQLIMGIIVISVLMGTLNEVCEMPEWGQAHG